MAQRPDRPRRSDQRGRPGGDPRQRAQHRQRRRVRRRRQPRHHQHGARWRASLDGDGEHMKQPAAPPVSRRRSPVSIFRKVAHAERGATARGKKSRFGGFSRLHCWREQPANPEGGFAQPRDQSGGRFSRKERPCRGKHNSEPSPCPGCWTRRRLACATWRCATCATSRRLIHSLQIGRASCRERV